MENIDKKLVQSGELNFIKEDSSKTMTLTDDGVVELYENCRLIEQKPFSKLSVEREYKTLIQEGYKLEEELSANEIITAFQTMSDKTKSELDESKKTEGYSLGDDKESFDIYKHTVDFLNKVGKELEELGWKYNKEIHKFEKEDKTIYMEALQDHVEDLYIESNKLHLSNLAEDYSNYTDIGEDTGIIYYVSSKAGDYEARQLASKIDRCNVITESKKVEAEDKEKIDLEQTEQDLKDNIAQVDDLQKLKDELNNKLDKLYNESIDIKTDLGIEPGSDEEAKLDDLLDTDYDLVWDDLDEDEKAQYNKVASTIRRLKPDEALIDIIDEINNKAKENKLEKDMLLYAYLNNKKTESNEYKMTPIPDELKQQSKTKPWTKEMYMQYYFNMANAVAQEYKLGNISAIENRYKNYNLGELPEINKDNIKKIINDIAFAYAEEKEKNYKERNNLTEDKSLDKKEKIKEMIKTGKGIYDLQEYIMKQFEENNISEEEKEQLLKFVQENSVYECMDCGNEFEIDQATITDTFGTPSCPHCGSGDVAGYTYLEESKRLNEKIFNKAKIEYVIPNYTGGGIYVYTGKLKDGNYFMAEDSIFNKDNPVFSIRIVNEDPDKVGEDSWYEDWQEEHLVRDVMETDTEAKEFTKQILQWIITNEPEGNYQLGDMKDLMYILTGKVEENKLEEYNEGTDFGEYTRLVNEIKLQAEENGYNLSDEEITKIADKMVETDNFFYDYKLPDPEDIDNEDWEEIHNVINDYLKSSKVEESVSPQKQKFIDYCKDKLENMGEVEIEEVTYNKIMHTEGIRQFDDLYVIADFNDPDFENLIAINNKNEIVIDTPMIDPNEYAAQMLFDKIDKKYYNDLLHYWEECNMDERIQEETEQLNESKEDNEETTLKIPTNTSTSKKLSKQEILDMNQITLDDKQAEYLKGLDITEEDIINGLQDLVKQMKYIKEEEPFISIEEYINEVTKF